jgi:hypothetical protein
MVITNNDNFVQGTAIIRNTENINGVRLKMPTSPSLTSQKGCRFIT